jgi:hypothetical protein
MRAKVPHPQPLHAAPGQNPLRGLTDDHLTAVRRRADPRRAVHVHADIVPADHPRLPCVHPHPDPHDHTARPRTSGESPLRRHRRAHGITSAHKRNEERIALSAHLVTAMRRDRTANDPAVLVKDVREALAEVLEQPRRPLDIAEQQRDRPSRKRHRPSHRLARAPGGARPPPHSAGHASATKAASDPYSFEGKERRTASLLPSMPGSSGAHGGPTSGSRP